MQKNPEILLYYIAKRHRSVILKPTETLQSPVELKRLTDTLSALSSKSESLVVELRLMMCTGQSDGTHCSQVSSGRAGVQS